MAFGEEVQGYPVRVFNEREVRASAGILFLFAFFSFMNALLIQNFVPLNIFIVGFFIDFLIRLFINPKYSPSLVVGRFFVSNQMPEYTGAPQKKFAWSLGLVLSTFMLFWLVVFANTGLVNLIVCLACLTFLFFESVFGICLGCLVYKWIDKETVQLCPGNVCGPKQKFDIQKINWVQVVAVVCFVLVLVGVSFIL